MFPTAHISGENSHGSNTLLKKIYGEKDVIHFKTNSPAYKNIITYVDLLCESIKGSGNKVFNHKYILQNRVFRECYDFLEKLAKCCDETDLKLAQTAGTLRFGHVAFRDWFDKMKILCKEFVDQQNQSLSENYRDELFTYLSESFGNRMRIDYGTGHELNFIIYTMGLSNLVDGTGGDHTDLSVSHEKLKTFVGSHSWDIHHLFAHQYLRLCRKIQSKFRLEPAGSRGVYNMDDFQFLPFLFGAAQLIGSKHIQVKQFHDPDQVDMFKNDFIFFEAIDFILNTKRGPFNEHSYTLWGFTNLDTWDNIYRRIRAKFNDDILGPFPVNQHFLFGDHILRWLPPK